VRQKFHFTQLFIALSEHPAKERRAHVIDLLGYQNGDGAFDVVELVKLEMYTSKLSRFFTGEIPYFTAVSSFR
jgi:hypothetical protein